MNITFEYQAPRAILAPDELEAMLACHRELPARMGELRYAGDLGWLDVGEWAGEAALKAIEELASYIRKTADTFVLVGVGGSNNAARAVMEALQTADSPRIVYMGNTLSPHALGEALARLEGRSVYVNCIAKNFETLEPGVSFRLLRAWLEKRYGAHAGERIVATGTPGSHLEALSREHGWRFLTFPPNIGGRFSALSNVGLLPMAVAGIDIRALAGGGAEMQRMLKSAGYGDNPALRYACLRNLLHQKGFRLELLSAFEPQFRYFYKWWVQLFAESEGKEGKGLFSASAEFSEDLHSMGQWIQDGTPILMETFLHVREPNARLAIAPTAIDDGFGYLDRKDLWDINQSAFFATRAAHSRRLPCVTLGLDRLDAEHFGALFYFFQYACYLSASILGINPFDQPGVEAYKALMYEALGKDGP